jgi:SAM-dependent methyltransferase
MQHFWNERYSEDGYAYGTGPNAYFKSIIDTLPPGRLLVPGAGEGRDAVYAATLGWEVDAFDLSSAGRDKALLLAAEKSVSIHYEVLDAADYTERPNTYDLIACVFFHLPSALRRQLNARLMHSLRPGGQIVVEAFTPDQLQYSSGGPKEISLLINADDLRIDFEALDTLECHELVTVLDEGLYHQGAAAVARFRGQITVL